jgi:ADP-ribose pyrophosphatase YjhB (NUDIX family)
MTALKTPQPIGACVIILNSEGKILLGKRKNSYKAGYYGLPGGRIEINEPLDAAIQREVQEETGLVLNNCEYVGVVRENQGDYDFIHFIYVAKNVDQVPQLIEPDKCEGWEWLDQSSTAQILPGHQAALNLYFQQLKIADLTTS